MEKTLREQIENMKKLRFVASFKDRKYGKRLKTEDARLVMKVKLNILPIYGNLGEKQKRCRLCSTEREETEHIMNCVSEFRGRKIKIEDENIETLREMAKRAKLIMEKIEV